jgi:hypothetical protein
LEFSRTACHLQRIFRSMLCRIHVSQKMEEASLLRRQLKKDGASSTKFKAHVFLSPAPGLVAPKTTRDASIDTLTKMHKLSSQSRQPPSIQYAYQLSVSLVPVHSKVSLATLVGIAGASKLSATTRKYKSNGQRRNSTRDAQNASTHAPNKWRSAVRNLSLPNRFFSEAFGEADRPVTPPVYKSCRYDIARPLPDVHSAALRVQTVYRMLRAWRAFRIERRAREEERLHKIKAAPHSLTHVRALSSVKRKTPRARPQRPQRPQRLSNVAVDVHQVLELERDRTTAVTTQPPSSDPSVVRPSVVSRALSDCEVGGNTTHHRPGSEQGNRPCSEQDNRPCSDQDNRPCSRGGHMHRTHSRQGIKASCEDSDGATAEDETLMPAIDVKLSIEDGVQPPKSGRQFSLTLPAVDSAVDQAGCREAGSIEAGSIAQNSNRNGRSTDSRDSIQSVTSVGSVPHLRSRIDSTGIRSRAPVPHNERSGSTRSGRSTGTRRGRATAGSAGSRAKGSKLKKRVAKKGRLRKKAKMVMVAKSLERARRPGGGRASC